MLSSTLLAIAMIASQDLAAIEKILVRAVDKSTYEAGAYQAARQLSEMRSVEAMEVRLKLFDDKINSYRGVFLRDWFFSGMLKAESKEELSLVAEAAADKKNSTLLRWVCLRALATAKAPVALKPLLDKSLTKCKDQDLKYQWQRTLGTLHAKNLLDFDGFRGREPQARVLADLNVAPGLGLAQLAGSEADFTATVIGMALSAKDPGSRAELLRLLGQNQAINGESLRPLLLSSLSLGKPADWNCALRAAAIDVIAERKFAMLIPEIIKSLAAETAQGGGRFAVDYGNLMMDLTGLRIGRNPDIWQRWWDNEGEQWLKDGASTPRANQQRTEHEQDTVASMFGVPVDSKRLVIALDGSGSMNDSMGDTTCLQAARREITILLDRLPHDAMFDLVVVEKELISSFGKLVKNTDKNRKKALALLERRNFRSTSSLYDALRDIQREWGADTILLIGDGGSSSGTHQYPGHMLSGLKTEYSRSGVRIHTVCTTSNNTKLRFMRKLAAISGGTMVQPPG